MKTPISDSLEGVRIAFKQERNAAYGDALALCRKLESALLELELDFCERSKDSNLTDGAREMFKSLSDDVLKKWEACGRL